MELEKSTGEVHPSMQFPYRTPSSENRKKGATYIALVAWLFVLVTAPVQNKYPRSSGWLAPHILGFCEIQQQRKPQTPTDAQVRSVLDKLASAGVGEPTTVQDVRKAYLFYPTLAGPPEEVYRVKDRPIPGPDGDIWLRLYTPSPQPDLPMLIFFHGGGFVAGSLDSHDTPLRALTNRCGCIVVSIAYRLAPEHKYPAAPEDAYTATKWVAEHSTEIGGDSHRVAVGGDGAGGNLAAVVSLMARERGTPIIKFQLLIYPMLDASTVRPSWWEETNTPTVSRESKNEILSLYLPVAASLSDPFISPLRAKNFRNLPPALIIAYEHDNPMSSESEDYADRLMRDGVHARVLLYPNSIHGFFLMAGELDAGKKCIEESAAALREAFHTSPKH